jgi:hypothetical protein
MLSQRLSGLMARRSEPIRLRPWAWVAAGGLVLSVAAGFGVSRQPEPLARPSAVAAPMFGLPYRNVEGGYAFRYPAGWAVRDRGTATTVRAPGRRAVVTFGLAPRGDLQEAERSLVGTIRDSYRRVRQTVIQVEPVGGRRAVTIAGTGMNRAGVPFRFLAATVAGSGRNRSITLFASRDGEDVMPTLQRILDSFRVLP